MKTVTFKGRNKTTIEVRFEKKIYFEKDCGLYQPIVCSKNQKKLIPLLLDQIQISCTLEKLAALKDTEYDFNLFREIVAGACSLSMKGR